MQKHVSRFFLLCYKHKRHSETEGQEPRVGAKGTEGCCSSSRGQRGIFTNDMQNNNPPREKLKKRDSNGLFHEAARLSLVLC